MLELNLVLQAQHVSVKVKGVKSHQFALLELSQTEKQRKEFFENPQPYGEKLFQALFKEDSEARKAFDDASKQSERTIILVLESSELDGVAWEYAYYNNAYIVEDFAFVRALPEKERPHSNGRLNKSVERVPLLFIPANPLVDLSGEPMCELDIESEWHEMTQYIVKSNAPFDLIELRPATPATLQSVMARFQNGMIAHFSGHGAATKDGAFLLFENENGSSNPLEAREFVREVKDQAWIGFLSACQSAVAERTAFGNLARELVKAGVPFALGMQFNLPDPFAPNISGQFYNYLAHGHAVPEAARQARRAVKRENEFYVGMIALYAAHPDEAGKMGWSGSGARTLSTFAEADVSDLPTPSGFIGRQRELMKIGTKLLGKKKPNTVTLHGAGGIGKTALMRQALLRFAPLFDSALAIALDPLPSLESVLGRLERFLNLPSPCSNDTKERERIVREKLTGREMLLGLDNFETLNYALNEKGSGEEQIAKSLHSYFKRLAAEGVTLCVTSREVTNLGGEYIEAIYGLPNDVGGRLFQENVVEPKQKEQIYIEKTQQVSEMVGGLPLALRLLASAFNDQLETSLDQYIENLQSFLPKARDEWTKEDRHESLRASFDFTMNNLLKIAEGKNLQTALAKLSMFVAFFPAVAAIPMLHDRFFEGEEKKEDLEDVSRQALNTLNALWGRGLLECATFVFPDKSISTYRVHPALRIFAKEHISDIKIANENYWKTMSQFISLAENTISKDPAMAQVTLQFMPDLLIATKYNNNQDAALMQFRVATLLIQFGLYDDSLRLCRESYNLSQSINYLVGMATTLNLMANISFTRGDLDGAIDLYQRSLKIAENVDNLQIKSVILHNLAQIYAMRSDLDRAMKLYQQSLDIFETLNDLENKSGTLDSMAQIHITNGDLDEAMRLFQQSLKIKDGIGDLRGKSDTLIQMAGIFSTRGDLDNAEYVYQQLLGVYSGFGDQEGKANALGGLAVICYQRGDYKSAAKLHEEALAILCEFGHLANKAKALDELAKTYGKLGNINKAITLFQQSFEIYNNLDALEGKSATLHNLGVALFQKNQFSEALRCFIDAMITFEKISKHSEVQMIANRLVQFRQVLGAGKFDSLWQTEIRQPVPEWLSQTPQQNQGMSAEQFIEGAIQSARGKRPEAEKYFKEAQRLAIDSNAAAELQSLGKVLQRIMIGEKNVDLSALTDELREMVVKALE